MKKQAGFTLIELVVVIVILGILSVTAAPRFMNIKADATKSALQGLQGAISSAPNLVYAKAALSNKLGTTGVLDNIKLVHGYPEASEDGIGNAVSGLKTDWKKLNAPADPNKAIFYGMNGAQDTGWKFDPANSTVTSKSTGCFVAYYQAENETTPPQTYLVTDKCK